MVLSASHNPMPDNGIKFLARGGHKLGDALETEIEQHLGQDWQWPTGGAVGRVDAYETAVEEYAAHLVRTTERPLAGLRSCSTARRAPRPTPGRRRSRTPARS